MDAVYDLQLQLTQTEAELAKVRCELKRKRNQCKRQRRRQAHPYTDHQRLVALSFYVIGNNKAIAAMYLQSCRRGQTQTPHNLEQLCIYMLYYF